ncbi:MAG TPA: cobyrinate a,c-diamide synthase [Aestuariivirga sp.]|nr:cobyrinate a,c-diamide synthase [Aestuariivirga sp.]
MAKAVIISAPSSASGKTVVTLGLLRALRNRGVRVASAKVGPDYIDPRFHEQATGRRCYNLDPWAMSPGQLRALLDDISQDSDLIIIEGVMGLFDGPHGASGSTADLGLALGLPVLLTIDARHQAQSVAALVHGFTRYRLGAQIAGVVLNRVASDRHEAILRSALGERVLATLRHDDSLVLPSRHLGLVQAAENQELEAFIERAASAVARETVLDRIIGIASQPTDESPKRCLLPPLGQRIAIARDLAFSFAYPHLLDAWQKAGSELTFFSPLADEAPAADTEAVFLPGGYPELHAGRLASCGTFREGLRRFDGLIYGECGGYMALGDALIDADGNRHAMAGLLPLVSNFQQRKLHLGYRQLLPKDSAAWTGPLRGHEFHYATVVSEGDGERLFDAEDAMGEPLPPMGLRRGKVMGSFAHVICEA